MATIREILVDWNLPSGTNHKTVMYFAAAPTPTSQRLAMSVFLTSLQASLVNTVSWTIQTAGRELESTDGSLVGAWTEATNRTGTGTVPTEQVADATQVLYQWLTGQIADGRFVRGRQFFPGLASSNLQDGNLVPGVRTGLKAYGTTFLAASVGFGVWHRPKKAGTPPVLVRPGQLMLASSAEVWTELAVLRRRRG